MNVFGAKRQLWQRRTMLARLSVQLVAILICASQGRTDAAERRHVSLAELVPGRWEGGVEDRFGVLHVSFVVNPQLRRVEAISVRTTVKIGGGIRSSWPLQKNASAPVQPDGSFSYKDGHGSVFRGRFSSAKSAEGEHPSNLSYKADDGSFIKPPSRWTAHPSGAAQAGGAARQIEPTEAQLAAAVEAVRVKAKKLSANAVPIRVDGQGRLGVLGAGTNYKVQLQTDMGFKVEGRATLRGAEFVLKSSASSLLHDEGDLICNVGSKSVELHGITLHQWESALSKKGKLQKLDGVVDLQASKSRPARQDQVGEQASRGKTWEEVEGVKWNGRLSINKPITLQFSTTEQGKRVCSGWMGDPPKKGDVTASGALVDGEGATVAAFQREPVQLKKEGRVFFQCDNGRWRIVVYPEEERPATVKVFRRR